MMKNNLCLPSIQSAGKIVALACAIIICGIAIADGGAWSARAPMQDTYVNHYQRDTAFGADNSIIVGNGRECCMVFDVSGLENVTAARLKFYVTQCAVAAGVKQPLYFCMMHDVAWSEMALTWNSLPDEFRVAPSPILATNDVSLAGYIDDASGVANNWLTVDLTAAVKSAAANGGLLPLHIYTPWDNTSGDTTPLAFCSSNSPDVSHHPVLEFMGESTNPELEPTVVLTAVEDSFIVKNSPDANMGSSDIVVQKDVREGFLKFDLSGISAVAVKFAKLRVRSNSQTQTGNTVQFQMIDDNWSENKVTWNNPPAGVIPGSAWPSTTPGNAVRVVTPGPDSFYDIELAPLVNYALATGKTTLSLHITLQNSSPAYFIFSSKESVETIYRPRLSIYVADSMAQIVTRKPVQETFVGSSNGGNTIYHNYKNWDYVQIGSSGSTIQYSLMQFDPAGLEDADFVRLRIKAHNTLPAGDGVLRVAAYITDPWNETNLTWSTTKPWFPQPASVAVGTAIDGEVTTINLSQSRSDQPFIEMDVTEAVRRAASAGQMITFALFSSSRAWPEFYKRTGQTPVLIFPDPDAAFAKRIVGSLDRGGAEPSMRLSWSPSSDAGVTYMVERLKNSTWITVADGLSSPTCRDVTAEPYVEHTYRITAKSSGTETSTTKTIILAPKVKVLACADAFVFSGNKDAQNGTATSIVHKYDLNASGTREGFYRFDLSEVPENFKTATLKFYVAGSDANHSGNEEFWVLKYPDFAWTDAAAPTWNRVFENEWSTPEARSSHADSIRMSEVPVNSVGSVPSRLLGGESFEYDVSAMIREAKANGESHVTFHTYAYDPDSRWSFDIISRERSQGLSCASQIVFTLRNWVSRGTIIILR